MIKCPYCGNFSDDQGGFCTACGSALNVNNNSAPNAYQQPPVQNQNQRQPMQQQPLVQNQYQRQPMQQQPPVQNQYQRQPMQQQPPMQNQYQRQPMQQQHPVQNQYQRQPMQQPPQTQNPYQGQPTQQPQAQKPYQGQPMQQQAPYYQQPMYNQQAQSSEKMPSVGGHTVMLVFSFILGVIWGAISMSFYSRMKQAINAGDAQTAWHCANKVKLFFFIGLGVNILFLIVYYLI